MLFNAEIMFDRIPHILYSKFKRGEISYTSKGMKGQKAMDEKNTTTYEIKRLRMPVSISSISKSNGRNPQPFNPGSLFLLNMQQGTGISNEIRGEPQKLHHF